MNERRKRIQTATSQTKAIRKVSLHTHRLINMAQTIYSSVNEVIQYF